jgi:hypothetical protein
MRGVGGGSRGWWVCWEGDRGRGQKGGSCQMGSCTAAGGEVHGVWGPAGRCGVVWFRWWVEQGGPGPQVVEPPAASAPTQGQGGHHSHAVWLNPAHDVMVVQLLTGALHLPPHAPPAPPPAAAVVVLVARSNTRRTR